MILISVKECSFLHIKEYSKKPDAFLITFISLFFRDIWNKFLEFECNIGDLQSIVKVEKRRSEVLSKIKEFEGKETAQLVDRYRFLDLFPCSPQELKSIG